MFRISHRSLPRQIFSGGSFLNDPRPMVRPNESCFGFEVYVVRSNNPGDNWSLSYCSREEMRADTDPMNRLSSSKTSNLYLVSQLLHFLVQPLISL